MDEEVCSSYGWTCRAEVVCLENGWRGMFDLFLRVLARGKISAQFFRHVRGASADL